MKFLILLTLIAALWTIGLVFENWIAIASLILSTIALLWAIGLTLIRPKLEIDINGGIEDVVIKKTKKRVIKIKVTNKSCYFDTTNLNIEACTVRYDSIKNGKKTEYLEIDKEGFLILRCKDDYRKFKAECTKEIEDRLKDAGVNFRVRVHSIHSFTGFGKAIEQCFTYDKKQNLFWKI